MSYATLQEIWPGFLVSDKFSKFRNTIPKNIVNSLIETSNNRGGNRSNGSNNTNNPSVEPIFYEKSREYPLANNTDEKIEKFTNENSYGKYQTECSSILTHLSHCEKCRNFVRQKFAPAKKEEHQEEEKEEEYLDLAIYIVTGIFILFVLDMLMKFGKRLR